MRLIGSLTSPFVRKVRVVLAEKKIECAFEVDSPWLAGNQVAKLNPLGKIPALVLDDGTTVYDSRVIVEYLDATTPNNRLIPTSARERLMVKRWEALADGVSDAAALIFLEKKRPEAQQSAEWIIRQQQKVDLGLAAMADDLGDQAWCRGTKLSLADIAVGTALGYLEFRFGELDWPRRYGSLLVLNQKLQARQSFIDTVPQA